MPSITTYLTEKAILSKKIWRFRHIFVAFSEYMNFNCFAAKSVNQADIYQKFIRLKKSSFGLWAVIRQSSGRAAGGSKNPGVPVVMWGQT